MIDEGKIRVEEWFVDVDVEHVAHRHTYNDCSHASDQTRLRLRLLLGLGRIGKAQRLRSLEE